MREIDASEITDAVARLCIDACHELPADVVQAFPTASW
jgi:fumarate hydratase subunit alpha